MVVWTVIYDVAGHLGISKHQWNVRASDIPRIFNVRKPLPSLDWQFFK
jgi:hypothetical protein